MKKISLILLLLLFSAIAIGQTIPSYDGLKLKQKSSTTIQPTASTLYNKEGDLYFDGERLSQEKFQGWIFDTGNPLPFTTVIETSIIYDSTTGHAYRWYRDDSDVAGRLYMDSATNSTLSNWMNKTALNLPGGGHAGFLPYVFKLGSHYLMTLTTGNDIKLYASTDKINFSYRNGGNPILTHSSTPTSNINQIFNPAIAIEGSKWHMVVETATSTSNFMLMYSYVSPADTSSMNFNTHISTDSIVALAGNPDLKYISGRNSLFLITGNVYNGHWFIDGRYASLSDDLTQMSSWKTPKNFPQIYKHGVHVADPFIVNTPRKKYKSLIDFNYGQLYGFQAYMMLTIEELFDFVSGSISLNGGICTNSQLEGGSLLVNGQSRFRDTLEINGPILFDKNEIYNIGSSGFHPNYIYSKYLSATTAYYLDGITSMSHSGVTTAIYSGGSGGELRFVTYDGGSILARLTNDGSFTIASPYNSPYKFDCNGNGRFTSTNSLWFGGETYEAGVHSLNYSDPNFLYTNHGLKLGGVIKQVVQDTTGLGSTSNIGIQIYQASNAHFYGLQGGSPPTWKQLDN